MIDRLPEGVSIGWMQAPPQWIFTHTVRFVGIVRVVIQDGEGFILIQKGKPLAYYFKHGRIELRGHAALDYFNSHPTIEFNLCKYTADELAEAMSIYNADEQGPAAAPQQPERKVAETVPARPAVPQPAPPFPVPEPPAPEPPVAQREERAAPAEPAPVLTRTVPKIVPEAPADVPEPVADEVVEPEPVIEQVPRQRPAMRNIPPPPPVIPIAPEVTPQPAIPSQQVVLDEHAIRVIGQIKKLNGVVAISVFNDDRNILLMGDVEIEPLLKIARNMLETQRKITPHLEWGSFVHITLQIPEGNVIVAPYQENYLCLLTTRTINIGHIRRILRDLQIGSG